MSECPHHRGHLTPQGGILSPLLADIALSALDEYFHAQWHSLMSGKYQREKRRKTGTGNWRLVRYADDFVVLVSGPSQRAEALREQVAEVLAPLGLRLSAEKIRLVHIDDGFDPGPSPTRAAPLTSRDHGLRGAQGQSAGRHWLSRDSQ
ncbi:reverse transcriptase/maturase family protein [Streptomyces sp. NPDC048417]|uniref:reverse transcriptase/maturase family protein n=1 Tax=Streptomyces sp. NPDC048417 TaxID=3155387 RepID=UPI0034144374